MGRGPLPCTATLPSPLHVTVGAAGDTASLGNLAVTDTAGNALALIVIEAAPR